MKGQRAKTSPLTNPRLKIVLYINSRIERYICYRQSEEEAEAESGECHVQSTKGEANKINWSKPQQSYNIDGQNLKDPTAPLLLDTDWSY